MPFFTVAKKIYDKLVGDGINVADVSKGTQTNNINVALKSSTPIVDVITDIEYYSRHGTQIIKNGSRTNEGSTLLYTVPANTVLYITSAWIGHVNSSGSEPVISYLYIGVTTKRIISIFVENSPTTDEYRSGHNLSLSFPMPLKVTAGIAIRLGVEVRGLSTAGFQGWLESA